MKFPILTLFLSCLFVLAASESASAARPNVLFIAIDDLNDWIGCLGGHPQVQTPNIDRLASQGTLFTNAHCQAPLCNSSRTSLLTGLRPSTTGIHGLAPWFRNVGALKDRTTLPQHFESSGYQTLSTGKIFHGGYGRGKDDHEFQTLGPAAGVGATPEKKLIPATPNGNHPLMDWGTFPHRDEDKGDWKVASWAVEQLVARPTEPFFLSVGFFLPHVPCFATQKWFDLYPEDTLQLPRILNSDRDDTPLFSWYLNWKLPEPRLSWCVENDSWKSLVRSYLACISFVDSQVGRVLDALDRSGQADNTIIVLWSDHGYHLGEKLITGKNTLWERSTHVPLVFAGPGISSNAVCDEAVELLDIFPTLNELCDLGTIADLEGHSLAPQLRNAQTERPWPAITTHNQGNHSVRSDDWRYIQHADGTEEFYDMRNDPLEWTNLAGQTRHGGLMAEHRKWIPRIDMPSAQGSAHRILTYDPATKASVWEGEPIRESERQE